MRNDVDLAVLEELSLKRCVAEKCHLTVIEGM